MAVALPRILLIDDDPLFGAILDRMARQGNIPLRHILSPRLLNVTGLRKSYDLLIVDYDLQNMTGIQLVRGLEGMLQSLPTLLVSSYNRITSGPLPESVFASLHKSEGPQKILWSVLTHAGVTPPPPVVKPRG